MPSQPPPLRTALIGLSASATTSWASTAHLPALLSPSSHNRFKLTALLNSSVSAASSAIKTYNLPADTKAYGSPEELAKDADIDLVICNTRVDKHYETMLPSIRAGKDVYIEWPVAKNWTQVDELMRAAREAGGRVAVGLQGRWTPPVVKIKEIVRSGRLGRVLSSEVKAYGPVGRDILTTGLKYFAEREVGGNPITIGVGHVVDFVQAVLGELGPGSVQAHLQLQRPDVRVWDEREGRVVETVRSDVPDLLALHGTLPSSTYTDADATLSFLFRSGPPFPSTPAFAWTINCELGEIRLVSPSGIYLQIAAYDEPITIQVHHFQNDTVEDVRWEWSEMQKSVPIPARALMSSLYGFADGDEEGVSWVGIEDAAKRAEQIQGWLDGWKTDES